MADGGEASFERETSEGNLFTPDPYRSFDHDPLVVGLQLSTEPVYECLGFRGTIDVLAATSGLNVIVGTDGSDRINGTAAGDLILGLDGDDRINGLSGEDVICGGAGDDDIRGNNGDDTIAGEAGFDRLFRNGEAGFDRLFGNGGSGDECLLGEGGGTAGGGCEVTDEV